MSSNLPPRKDKNRVPRQKRELPVAPKKEAERIAKVVARAGLASRREIEEWITEGRVSVNGVVLESPAVTVTAADVITVDGEPLPERERTRLFFYHKPRGVVTTNRDPEGRTTLFELLPGGLPRLVSVGRLDLNSEGLLLLTNDGGLSRVLELPETGWLRRYRVRAHGDIDQARLDTLIKGINVNGVDYGPIEAELERVQGSNAWITVSLREGKNREVRNVLGALGLVVNRLIRISYGPFQLGDLPEGEIEEVSTRILRDQIGEELSAAAGADYAGPLVERERETAPPRPALRTAARPTRSGRPSRGYEDAAQPRDGGDRPFGPRERRRISETNELESRGTVADRKGRTVKVERVVPGQNEPPRDSRSGRGESFRNARPERSGSGFGSRDDGPRRGPSRSFGGPREDRPTRGGFRQDRPREDRGPDRGPRRFDGQREDRPAREDFRQGRPRDQRGADRGPRRFDGQREDRPARDGFRQDRPREDRGADRGPRRFDGQREDRPARDGFRQDRPREDRGADRGPRRFDGQREDRPARDGFRQDRPREDRGADRGPRRFDGPREDRPARDGFRQDRPREDRPRKPGFAGPRGYRPEGERTDRSSHAPREDFNRKRSDTGEFEKRGPANRGGKSFGGGRPEGRSFNDRPTGGERPRGERSESRNFGEKPFAGGSRSERPVGQKFGAKPGQGAGRPGGSRSGGGTGKGFGPRPSGGPSGNRSGGPKGGAGRGPGGPRRKD